MPDISDRILRIEEKAIEMEEFNEKERNYMAEEFLIQPDL